MAVPVLHCYADYKWTGPSGPVARLCRNLTDRGWRSDLACMFSPDGAEKTLGQRARETGLRVFDEFYFDSNPNIHRNLRDARKLRDVIAEEGYGLVHCHGTWDQAVCRLAMARRHREIPLVRTDHKGREYGGNPVHRLYYGPAMVDHLIVLSDRWAVQAVDRLKVDPAFVSTVPGAVDCDRYRPVEPPPGKRAEFGLSDEDVVFGVVSRVQWHRRFDVLLDAALILQKRNPRVKIVVCGRGTHRHEILNVPVVQMGLQDTVFPLGYRTDDYEETIATFDAGIMLVPGSDGSCRAAMEMAAMGTPLVVAQRGTLPDIVRDGATGMVVRDMPELLARAILRMAVDPKMRRRMGKAARERMKSAFSPEGQTQKVIEVYRRVVPGL